MSYPIFPIFYVQTSILVHFCLPLVREIKTRATEKSVMNKWDFFFFKKKKKKRKKDGTSDVQPVILST